MRKFVLVIFKHRHLRKRPLSSARCFWSTGFPKLPGKWLERLFGQRDGVPCECKPFVFVHELHGETVEGKVQIDVQILLHDRVAVEDREAVVDLEGRGVAVHPIYILMDAAAAV
eukprot:4025304-Pyramimonas_sp.AAC.1